MGTTLTGTTPQDTYDSLIKVTDNGPLSGSLKTLTDGLGNDSALALSTGAASITGTLAVSGNATFDTSTLVVDATNDRVGIGTSSPATLVEVSTSQDPIVRLNNSSTSIANDSDIGEIQFYTNDASAAGTGVKAFVKSIAAAMGSSQGSASLVFGTADNNDVNALERVRILPSGNVGIGTSSPAYPLSIIGDTGLEGNENYLYFHSTYSIGNNARARMRAVGAGGGSGYGGDLRIDTRAQNNSWNTDVVTVANTGNVGIGTSNPAQKLTVYRNDSGNVSALIENAFINQGNLIQFNQNTTSGTVTALIGHGGDSTGDLTFFNGGSKQVSITSAGVLSLTQGQIKFPATQVASADANTLDDYEEGTFTPTVEGSSSAGTATYSVQDGKYTKIGNQVSILIDLSWSGGTGTGVLRIVGLPFTNAAFNTAGSIGFINDIALTASNYATTYVAPSSTRLDFVQSPTGGGSVTDVAYDAAGRLIISATYFVS